MTKTHAEIRPYCFLNKTTNEYGLPFALCSGHVETFKVPENCQMERLPGGTEEPCNLCELETVEGME